MTGTTSTTESITVTVPSASAPDVWYTLTIHGDGVITCSCKGYTYRRTCRHTRAEIDRLARWNSRTCGQCGASGPLTAFVATTEWSGGHGYATDYACRNTAACAARCGVAVA